MRTAIVIIASAVVLSACAPTHNLVVYESIDQNAKTVTVPPGSEGLKGKLKQALVTDGWKLFVYRGPSVSEGEVGDKTKIEQYDTFNSRYHFIATASQYDICFDLSPRLKYDISFIDNKTGAEVFTLSGKGCEPDIVGEFSQLLHR